MANFTYIAINEQNKTIKGKVEAATREDAINAISKQNLRPVSIQKIVAKQASTFENMFKSNHVKADHLVMFTRQLSAMVGAGVPLLRALTALADHITDSPALKRILQKIIKDVEGGLPLGDALGRHPATFNDVYVNMVRAGEAAGILDDILNRLALQQEKSTSMRKKIKSSMMYPMVLLAITTLAFFGLMLFVVPQIGEILDSLSGGKAELPAITQIMLSISDFMIQFWYVVIVGLAGAVFGFFTYIRTKKGRYVFHTVLLKTPMINKIITKVAVGYFTRTFSALIEAGVAVLEALEVTSHAVGNAVFEEAILEAAKQVKLGKSLSAIIETKEIFPPIVSQMLLVGEETGQTDRVLTKVADFYEEEVDRAIEGIGSIIEPIMILIMGSMVGLVAASVMIPIAGLAQSIQ